MCVIPVVEVCGMICCLVGLSLSVQKCVNDVRCKRWWLVVFVIPQMRHSMCVSLRGSSSLMRISAVMVVLQTKRCTFACVVGFCRAPPAPGIKGTLWFLTPLGAPRALGTAYSAPSVPEMQTDTMILVCGMIHNISCIKRPTDNSIHYGVSAHFRGNRWMA